MTCRSCQEARRDFIVSAQRGDVRGATQAVGRAIDINVAKVRGFDYEAQRRSEHLTRMAREIYMINSRGMR